MTHHLLDLCASALDQNYQNHNRQNPGDNSDYRVAVHYCFPFLFFCYFVTALKDSIITIAAGPSVTTNSAGKMTGTSVATANGQTV